MRDRDKGGRRRIADRRRTASSDHFPERRALRHRRNGRDRRRHAGRPRQTTRERRRALVEPFLRGAA